MTFSTLDRLLVKQEIWQKHSNDRTIIRIPYTMIVSSAIYCYSIWSCLLITKLKGGFLLFRKRKLQRQLQFYTSRFIYENGEIISVHTYCDIMNLKQRFRSHTLFICDSPRLQRWRFVFWARVYFNYLSVSWLPLNPYFLSFFKFHLHFL